MNSLPTELKLYLLNFDKIRNQLKCINKEWRNLSNDNTIIMSYCIKNFDGFLKSVVYVLKNKCNYKFVLHKLKTYYKFEFEHKENLLMLRNGAIWVVGTLNIIELVRYIYDKAPFKYGCKWFYIINKVFPEISKLVEKLFSHSDCLKEHLDYYIRLSIYERNLKFAKWFIKKYGFHHFDFSYVLQKSCYENYPKFWRWLIHNYFEYEYLGNVKISGFYQQIKFFNLICDKKDDIINKDTKRLCILMMTNNFKNCIITKNIFDNTNLKDLSINYQKIISYC